MENNKQEYSAENFQIRLKEVLKAKKIKQYQLAKFMGIDKQTITNWLGGTSRHYCPEWIKYMCKMMVFLINKASPPFTPLDLFSNQKPIFKIKEDYLQKEKKSAQCKKQISYLQNLMPNEKMLEIYDKMIFDKEFADLICEYYKTVNNLTLSEKKSQIGQEKLADIKQRVSDRIFYFLDQPLYIMYEYNKRIEKHIENTFIKDIY